jgi:hypothetical protein
LRWSLKIMAPLFWDDRCIRHSTQCSVLLCSTETFAPGSWMKTFQVPLEMSSASVVQGMATLCSGSPVHSALLPVGYVGASYI